MESFVRARAKPTASHRASTAMQKNENMAARLPTMVMSFSIVTAWSLLVPDRRTSSWIMNAIEIAAPRAPARSAVLGSGDSRQAAIRQVSTIRVSNGKPAPARPCMLIRKLLLTVHVATAHSSPGTAQLAVVKVACGAFLDLRGLCVSAASAAGWFGFSFSASRAPERIQKCVRLVTVAMPNAVSM